MIGRTNTGGGSGGGAMNFRVIGGTSAPNAPKENDIWVNTDEKITAWAFASEEPFSETKKVDCVIGMTDSMLNTSGAEASYPQSNITEYIKLPEGTTKITISNCDVVSSTMSHAFYTADKTLISTVERKKGVTTYEVPLGAVYVRLTLFDNSPTSFDPMSFVAVIGVDNGFAWVSTGTSSSVEFNALKKNGIQVYPISAKQYVDGAWVYKETKVYQSGEWCDWVKYLFNKGDTNSSVTGGLTGYAYGNASSGSQRKTPTVTYGNTAITISVPQVSPYNNSIATLYTEKLIDLTGLSIMEINVTARTGNSNTMVIGLTATKSDKYTNVAQAYIEKTGITTLDVSSLDGEYYAVIGLGGAGDKSLTFDTWGLK